MIMQEGRVLQHTGMYTHIPVHATCTVILVKITIGCEKLAHKLMVTEYSYSEDEFD